MNLYTFAKNAVAALLYPVYRFEVIGKVNVPKSGPVIICSNHISNLDPPVVGITTPRDIHFMAKGELFSVPVFGTILHGINAFPVKRGLSDRNALRRGLKIQENGETLGLFPEGTRSKTESLGKPLSGVGFFALRSKAAVVPCAIIGPYKPGKRLKVVYGEPMDIEAFRASGASAKETSEGIMEEIKKLLEKYKS